MELTNKNYVFLILEWVVYSQSSLDAMRNIMVIQPTDIRGLDCCVKQVEPLTRKSEQCHHPCHRW